MHGNARKLTDALGHVTTQSFDNAGRLTQVVRPSGYTENYAYDGAGQRIRHWNSQFGTGDVETSDYDMMGRITSQRGFGGYTVDASRPRLTQNGDKSACAEGDALSGSAGGAGRHPIWSVRRVGLSP
ncbi:MAG: RHS repeat protein [Proteobacteria bacterium]|nr:RHS repeat protein [Pseudomonadota bacterium]